MTEKNIKKKFFTEIMMQWRNGASSFILRRMIEDYAEEVLPGPSVLGYSSRLNPVEWDTLIESIMIKAERALEKEVKDAIYKVLKEKYERIRAMKPRPMTNDEIYKDIHKRGCFSCVKNRLYELLDIWDVIDQALTVVEDQKTDLGKFVTDKQNVHTRVVNRQTDTALASFAIVPVNKKQHTLDEIISCWLEKYSWDDIQPIFKDMSYWGSVSEVIKKNDYAYRNALRALWAKIKTYEGDLRKELEKRLFEECKDSVEMCAQGHLSRLGNVLVGYVEMEVKESFQDKMVAISLKNVNESIKIAEATKIMDEMKMPQKERLAWLEAF
jgi:hypothetical protein